ncbi:MAG: phosphatase PAP2 family protein [Tatlockia sp.]|nr:phosphatase PAP2 family protein [Tatlockia sp.]
MYFARNFNLITAAIICGLSIIALVYNHYRTHFVGNNYFPPDSSLIFVILILIFLGSYLVFDKQNPFFKIAKELLYFFLLFSVIAFATNAVQFAPFRPIDKSLILIDQALGIHLDKIIGWTLNKPSLKDILVLSYDSLPMQMTYLPLLLIFCRQFYYLREYYSLLLITTLLGFLFYYFWPTLGPASVFNSPYFSNAQHATGIKFIEIHSKIVPSTQEGGMIAMPSFHMIWALLGLNLSRCSTLIFIPLLILNVLLISSCILLGWHYLIDLLGSIITLGISYLIYLYFVALPLRLVNFEGNKHYNLAKFPN